MHKIHFYRDSNGNEPVAEYIAELAQKKDKDSRIKLNKIRDYIKVLSEYGTQAGEPYIKHLDGEIWELCTITPVYEENAENTLKGDRKGKTRACRLDRKGRKI